MGCGSSTARVEEVHECIRLCVHPRVAFGAWARLCGLGGRTPPLAAVYLAGGGGIGRNCRCLQETSVPGDSHNTAPADLAAATVKDAGATRVVLDFASADTHRRGRLSSIGASYSQCLLLAHYSYASGTLLTVGSQTSAVRFAWTTTYFCGAGWL